MASVKKKLKKFTCRANCIVGLATRYRLDSSGLEPGDGKKLSVLHTYLDLLWGPSSFLNSEYQSYFPESKWPGYGLDHPLLLPPEVNKEQSCTCTPLCVFMTYYRKTFTFIKQTKLRLCGTNTVGSNHCPSISHV